jgi:hypothetical protein
MSGSGRKNQTKTKVNTVCDTPPYGHAPTYQLSLTYLEREKCYGPDKKILFKKQLFDLEVKGQGPMNVITVRDTPPYGHAYTNYLSMKFCWICLNYLTLRSKVKVPQRSLWYATHHLMVCTHKPIIIDLPRKTKCYGLDKKILSKKQVFDLEVRGQSPTKVNTVRDTPPYVHAPTYEISLTYLERVMVWTSFAEKKQKKWKKRKKKKKSD